MASATLPAFVSGIFRVRFWLFLLGALVAGIFWIGIYVGISYLLGEEIAKLAHAVSAGGYTLIPLKLYFSDGRAKVEIALAKGKREYDKRQALRERQDNMEATRAIRENRDL